MIDDDGSGTTGTIINNAWKQELYGQIDALQVRGTWTPVDASGAGLVLTATGLYVATPLSVHVWADVIFPATSNGSAATLGGLPFPVALIHAGGHLTWGPIPMTIHFPSTNTKIFLYNPTGAALTNVGLSGAHFIFAGSYAR
jgi:hypothetical protein